MTPYKLVVLIDYCRSQKARIEAKVTWTENDFMIMYWNEAKVIDEHYTIMEKDIQRLAKDERTPFKMKLKAQYHAFGMDEFVDELNRMKVNPN